LQIACLFTGRIDLLQPFGKTGRTIENMDGNILKYYRFTEKHKPVGDLATAI